MLLSRRRVKSSVALVSLSAALGFVGLSGQARAATLTPTDLATAFSGDVLSPVAGFSETVNVMDNGGYVTGTLTNDVYKIVTPNAINPNNGQYVYEEIFTEAPADNPKGHNMDGLLSTFTLDEVPPGFTPGTSLIGWSYSQAAFMGLTGTAADFSITQSIGATSGAIEWDDVSRTFTIGDPVTFYYESKDPPGTGQYSVNDDDAGTATSYAPVAPVAMPTPAADSMGLVVLAGLAGIYMVRRRRAMDL